MTTRRILLGALLALSFAACSNNASVAPTTGSAAPTGAASTGTGAGSSAIIDPTSLQGFCATFASDVSSTWPNIDAATAGRIGPQFRTWADSTDFTSVKADMTTVFNWLATASISTATATPPADVMTAFDHIKAFADSNC